VTSASFCSWEVLPSESRLPIVSSGLTTDPAKAKKDVEDAMSTRPEAGLGQLVRHVMPGFRPDPDDREWPPLAQVWLCRRARPDGYAWRPLFPDATREGPAASRDDLSIRQEHPDERHLPA
jgi:hypothetical protein